MTLDEALRVANREVSTTSFQRDEALSVLAVFITSLKEREANANELAALRRRVDNVALEVTRWTDATRGCLEDVATKRALKDTIKRVERCTSQLALVCNTLDRHDARLGLLSDRLNDVEVVTLKGKRSRKGGGK